MKRTLVSPLMKFFDVILITSLFLVLTQIVLSPVSAFAARLASLETVPFRGLHTGNAPHPTNQFKREKKNLTLAKHLFWSHSFDILNRPLSSSGRFVFMVKDSGFDLVRRVNIRFNSFPFLTMKPVPPLSNHPVMDIEEWEDKLDRLTGTLEGNGRLQFLFDGEAYFPRLTQALKEAKSSIHMQTYIFDNDDVAVDVAGLLKSRSREVEVRVMYDGLGTILAQNVTPEYLPPGFRAPSSMKGFFQENSDVQVRSMGNTWLAGDHIKSTIIDRRVAFVGGMNIGREYRYDWHDMMVEVKGSIVDKLENQFGKTWSKARFSDAFASIFQRPMEKEFELREKDYPIRFVYTRPGRPILYKAQLLAIRWARRRIYIENAYLSDDKILFELCRARKRGVDVKVILPETVNHKIMQQNNKIAINTLLKHGVRVYLYPGMTHIKAAVFDGWACFGTANYDKLSLHVNRELNLATSHPETVQELLQSLFLKDIHTSREVKQPLPLKPFDHVMELLADAV